MPCVASKSVKLKREIFGYVGSDARFVSERHIAAGPAGASAVSAQSAGEGRFDTTA